ncbi:SDR family oxidoreductase [Acetobacteraceae bacterium H6797]|nr:SDR family oxidoreductase [Acetobacteraceae bacterium H6797]
MSEILTAPDPARFTPGRGIALVTGGASGIGLAITEDLARTHQVLALSRDPEKLAAVAKLPHVQAIAAELTDAEALERVAAPLARLDVLVHSAAISGLNTLESASLADWRASFETNVFAPAELTRLLLPALRAAEGQVIFISSGAGTRPVPDRLVYTASKHALRGLTDALRIAEAPKGLRVATVAPGPTDTPMNRRGRKAETGSDERLPGRFSDAAAHAAAVRLVVDMTPDSQVTEVVVRPRLL